MDTKPSGNGRFAIGDRVRIKYGANRGHYGTIRHIREDDEPYYGVVLDCETTPIGYSDYELEAA